MRLCSILSETTIFNLLVLREGREKKVFRPQEFYSSNFRVKAGPDYMISLIVSLTQPSSVVV